MAAVEDLNELDDPEELANGLCVEIADDTPPAAPAAAGPIKELFQSHAAHLRNQRRARKQRLRIQTIVPTETAASGSTSQLPPTSQPVVEPGTVLDTDVYDGDAVLRTLRQLLAMVDDRGYTRSSQQVQFHDAFTRATSRVMYKKDWSRSKPQIMAHNKWTECPSQILVSTPRRFGKTFRYRRASLTVRTKEKLTQCA